MNGNTWIIIGIVAGAVSLFAIPYGFHLKQKNQEITGDYVARDKIKVEGDYIKGDKIVLNQTKGVGGDFIQIANFLNFGSTGIFVNFALSIANFVGERKSTEGLSSVDDYLKWLHKSGNQNVLKEQHYLFVSLERKDDKAKLFRSFIEDLIRRVEDQKVRLPEIVEQTKLHSDMNAKHDYLVGQFSKNDSSRLRKGQLAISSRVLDMLSEGIVGSGVKVMMKEEINAQQGTAMVVWLLGTQSPNMMLYDLVGDVDRNRISLILNNDASISLRVYDRSGHKTEIKSASYPLGQRLVIIGVWKDQEISLWINGELQGSPATIEGFDYLGPTCLFGIDIEGKLSADAVRWTPPGQEVGLNFMKNGIWNRR